MLEKGRFLIGLLIALVPATAFAQLAGSSGIAGVVRDTSGAVLPGVTVEASSPALIEQTRTVVTDGQGRYNIVELRPGQYTVTFSLPGFSTVRREGVELAPNFTATVNAELRVGALEETITVRGESPVVDVLRVESRNVISKDALETLPTNKTLPAFVALTPGLVAAATSQDVGGSKGEVFIQPAIHGGRTTESARCSTGSRPTARTSADRAACSCRIPPARRRSASSWATVPAIRRAAAWRSTSCRATAATGSRAR